MPNSTLPGNNYLGDGQRTTSEFQAGIDQVAAWLNAAQDELDALTGTTFGEAAVRGVGTSAGNVPDKAVLDTRLGTSGNLGSMALESADGYYINSAQIDPGGDFEDTGQGDPVIYIRRSGDIVTVTSGLLSHLSMGVADSASGVIPSWARPITQTRATFMLFTGSALYNLTVNTNGNFAISYFNQSGSSISRDGSATYITVSYVGASL